MWAFRYEVESAVSISLVAVYLKTKVLVLIDRRG